MISGCGGKATGKLPMDFFDGSCAVNEALGNAGRIYLCFPYGGNNENVGESCWIYDGNQFSLLGQTKMAHQGGQLAFFNNTVLGERDTFSYSRICPGGQFSEL